MGQGLRLGRLLGFEIRLDPSWFLALALVTWTLAAGFFPSAYPDWDRPLYWLAGFLAALLLFGSVLAHELAHATVARARGLPVHGITLFIFGGVAQLRAEAASAADEFAIAIVGPATSLVLALICWLLRQAVAEGGVGAAILTYLALINVALALFNLLPGFPLDGGRVLRALLWGATGSFRRATLTAATVGQGLAFLLIGLGVLRVLSGDVLGGLWTAFIGWFLYGAADQSKRQVTVEAGLRGVPVRGLMDPQPETVSPDLSLEDLVFEYFLGRGRRAFPVLQDGRLVGIISLTDVKPIPPSQWARRRVAEVMTRAPLWTVRPQDDLAEALRLLAEHDIHQLLVVDDDRLLGLLDRADLLRFLQFQNELGVADHPRRRRWPG